MKAKESDFTLAKKHLIDRCTDPFSLSEENGNISASRLHHSYGKILSIHEVLYILELVEKGEFTKYYQNIRAHLRNEIKIEENESKQRR